MKHPTNFVDLFTSTLQPMVHYVPIKPDLSDIEQQVNYVLDEKNSDEMDNIVNNAQSWCRQHMVRVCVCVCVCVCSPLVASTFVDCLLPSLFSN